VLADKVVPAGIVSDPGSGCQRRLDRAYHDAVFIVAWDGAPPDDKAAWIQILREVLAAELGSYRIVFKKLAGGWRFSLEWREDPSLQTDDLIANSPESVAYNIYVNLASGGKPVDPGWRPGS
jgi:hypothetical protein